MERMKKSIFVERVSFYINEFYFQLSKNCSSVKENKFYLNPINEQMNKSYQAKNMS